MNAPNPQRATDCWGRLNDVADVGPVLTILHDLPDGFRQARRAMIARLGLHAGGHVLEAGCGPGTALPDLLEHVGPNGHIAGVDPTRALVAEATTRAATAGAAHATYAIGDIRELSFSEGSFDAAFCDKILVHVSPPAEAVGELVRVTRPGGRVGVVEWYSQGMMIGAADYALTRRVLDGSAPLGALNPTLPLELESLLAKAGLTAVEGASIVAEARHFRPGLVLMLSRRVQQAVELGALSPVEGDEWLRDLRSRDAEGRFYWAAVVRWAVGTRR